jgi:hypothetical protein
MLPPGLFVAIRDRFLAIVDAAARNACRAAERSESALPSGLKRPHHARTRGSKLRLALP